MREKSKSVWFRRRRILVALCHAAIVFMALEAAFLLRFDLVVPFTQVELLRAGLAVAIPLKLVVFLAARLHKGWWHFVGVRDLTRVAVANVVASCLFTLSGNLLIGPAFPRSVYLIDLLLCFLGTTGIRFAVRLYSELLSLELKSRTGRGLLIYGAGAAGKILLYEIHSNPSLGYKVVGFLDDDIFKRSVEFLNVPVLGTGRDAARIVDKLNRQSQKVEEIIIAMPSAGRRQMQEAIANCRGAGVPCRTLPGVRELLVGRVLNEQIRDLSIADLLGREEVHLEEERIAEKIAGRSILVTGAAGSIGSELCRQIARYDPARLVAFDQAESELYKLELDLKDRFTKLDFVVEIGDICDRDRVREVLREQHVQAVFHAAAYKHVPLMETHVLEAVKNNVLGTWTLLEAARAAGVSDFLMISSDKAVNPVSVMGVTKRAAELIVSAAGGAGASMNTVSVRFGNVLASSGSVVPLFQAQIAAGGPVKVTHPEMRRYFMSLPEAAQLVLQASAMGRGAEVFVLEMGEPIRIADLAENMIRLNGLKPGDDIQIRFTGLRNGERLYEELITAGEHVRPTYHPKIKIFRGPGLALTTAEGWLQELSRLLQFRDPVRVVAHLHKLVPEYKPSTLWASALESEPSKTMAANSAVG